MNLENLSIYSDGGARGNPGPGACAFIVNKNGVEIAHGAKFFKHVTNNVAEYQGVLLALKWIDENMNVVKNVNKVFFYLDSELVVKQINGLYKVKNSSLINLNNEIINLINRLKINIVFSNISRNKNKTADRLLNQEIDKQLSK